MNYRTLFNELRIWLFSDVNHIACFVIGMLCAYAIIGFIRSMKYAKVTGRYGRRVL